MLVAETFLSKTFLEFFVFLIAMITIQGQQLCQAGYTYLFLFFRL